MIFSIYFLPWTRLLLGFLALSVVDYYITMTIMEGSIFNPFYRWLDIQYLVVRGTGGFAERFWEEVYIHFNYAHCLGTHVGVWFIGLPLIVFYGERLMPVEVKRSGVKKFFFWVCCVMIVGFISATGGLVVGKVFDYL